MPISGSSPNKAFTRQVNAFTGDDAWQQLDVSGRGIIAEDQDNEGVDIKVALNAMLMRDGGNFAEDIPANGFKFTGIGNASARTHFAAYGQVQDSSSLYAGTSSGTDTITAALTPVITSYVAGQTFHFLAGGTNTGAATLNLNSVSAVNLRKGPDAATALAAGDITTGGIYFVTYTGSVFHLLNPKVPVGYGTSDSPQFAALELGNASDTTLSRLAAGILAVEGLAIYPNIPQNSQSTAYTTVLADAQKHILHPTADNNARTFTIAANASVAYPVGTAITFVNQINTVTIAINSDTLVLSPDGTTGSRTLAVNGMATALKIATTTWIISGSGLT